MHYLGGKARIAKKIAHFLNEKRDTDIYWEPFFGAGWIAQYIDAPTRYLSDVHPELMAMWRALEDGWEPPNYVSEEDYQLAKDGQLDKALTGFIGFGCSWSGKWFGGYARDGTDRNYALNAKNSLAKKMEGLEGAVFFRADYYNRHPSLIAPRVQIYCDPPYNGTTGYKGTEEFNHDKFWKEVRRWSRKGHDVYVSEYEAPDDFATVLEIETKTDLRTSDGGKEPRIEKVFQYKDKHA